MARASENIPSKPFAQAVWLPARGQWIVTPWYEYSEFHDAWRGLQKESVTVGDGHGFDQNNGMVLIEYGFARNWAADLQVGYTSLSQRYFTPDGEADTTRGLMDVTFGVRWQVLHEADAPKWAPTVTLRAGGIVRGSYDIDFPYAPGNGAVGIEPSVLLSKNFGWQGFGMYGNIGYRAMRSGGNDAVFGSIGFRQEFRGFTFNAGYRHHEDVEGDDIGGMGNTIVYSPRVREIYQQMEFGLGYTDKGGRRYQFYFRQTFDGRNTGEKQVYGIYASFPIGGKNR
jgi:hypothetical protein